MKLLKTLSILIIAAALSTGAYLAVSSLNGETPQELGSDSSQFVGGSTYTIAGSGITSSATSITLTSLTIPQNGVKLVDSNFSDTFYVTIEPGNTSRQEFASCTTVTQNAAGTATLSGCTRGLSPVADYTASSTLQFAHAGGSKLIFSNPPQLYNDAAFKNNDETVTGLWDFSTVFPTISLNSGLPTTSLQIATKAYADNIANQGAATSSETVSGINQLATALEQASSTDNGANDPLVLQTKYATDTPQYGCAVGYTGIAGAACTVIADLAGNIWKTVVGNLNVANTWTALQTFASGFTATDTATFSATTTASANTPGFNTQEWLVASTTITGSVLPQPVFVASSTGALLVSDANIQNEIYFDGFAVSSGVNGENILVQTTGIVEGFSGLTPGSTYYVQDAVGTIGTSLGTYETKVGVAISATQILIQRGNWEYMGSTALSSGNATAPSGARFAIAYLTAADQSCTSMTQNQFILTNSNTATTTSSLQALCGGSYPSGGISSSWQLGKVFGRYSNNGTPGDAGGTVYWYR